ncbi:uncharacterized protein LOC108733252 [Agrilus planipennis]|uniref:Uncharacterized protein LOC108733252 n=1 Tax=Agrilus planipennis TaxID=224129 RepID=A0A1W4W6X6_AGRPL|nr:uncharacterized protein LOC108733252 [Agrilus planipennis]
MNSLVIFFSVALSMVSAATVVNPGFVQLGPMENNVLVKGPSTSTNVAGPDGSLITSNADAGAVTSSATSGYVLQTQPVPFLVPNPFIWRLPFPYFFPNLPFFINRPGAIIDGPSGTIIASR